MRLRAALAQAQEYHENATAQQMRDEAEAALEKVEEFFLLSMENERLKAENQQLKADRSVRMCVRHHFEAAPSCATRLCVLLPSDPTATYYISPPFDSRPSPSQRQRLEETLIHEALASIEEQKLDLLAEAKESHGAIVELECVLLELTRIHGKVGLCRACGWLSSGLCHCGSGHKMGSGRFRPHGNNVMAYKRDGGAGRYARAAVEYAVGGNL